MYLRKQWKFIGLAIAEVEKKTQKEKRQEKSFRSSIFGNKGIVFDGCLCGVRIQRTPNL